jgi:hypothetical protein
MERGDLKQANRRSFDCGAEAPLIRMTNFGAPERFGLSRNRFLEGHDVTGVEEDKSHTPVGRWISLVIWREVALLEFRVGQ